MFSAKAKFYALLALFVLGALLGWRRAGVQNALDVQQAKLDGLRLQSIKFKQEAERDAENQSDFTLIDRLSRD